MGVHIHRTGPVLPKAYPVQLAVGVKANDIPMGYLVGMVAGFLVPVNATSWWSVDEATTRAAFIAAFAGLASGQSDKDVPLDLRDLKILVTQDGEIEFAVASAQYLPGTFLTVAKDAAGNYLSNTLVATATKNLAVAVVSEDSGAAATRARGYLLKTLPKRGTDVDLDVS